MSNLKPAALATCRQFWFKRNICGGCVIARECREFCAALTGAPSAHERAACAAYNAAAVAALVGLKVRVVNADGLGFKSTVAEVSDTHANVGGQWFPLGMVNPAPCNELRIKA